MYQVGEFLKVSQAEFFKSARQIYPNLSDVELKDVYDKIKLPCRATSGSAGYDFFTPFEVNLSPHETVLLPTGVRVKIDFGWFLAIVPKSGLGFKYRLQLDNTVGIIDSDYFFSDNEGHIFVKLTNDSTMGKKVSVKVGASVCQGIFLPFGIIKDEEKIEANRNGGFGSTSIADK